MKVFSVFQYDGIKIWDLKSGEVRKVVNYWQGELFQGMNKSGMLVLVKDLRFFVWRIKVLVKINRINEKF